MKDRILHYLANGIKPAQVATIVGCTPAYISQLLSDDSFKLQLTAALADQPAGEEETKLLTKYEAMEHQLLASMTDAMVGAELPAISNALMAVAKIQDMKAARKAPPVNPMGPGNLTQIVQLTFPSGMQFTAPVLEMNDKQEIVAIDSQPLAPMSAMGVKNLFAQMRASKEQHVIANEI